MCLFKGLKGTQPDLRLLYPGLLKSHSQLLALSIQCATASQRKKTPAK